MGSFNRRSKMEIYVDILEAVAAGNERPTRIMFKANLSWLILQEALDYLMTSGLLQETAERGRRIYGVTTKGLNIIEDFRRVRGELTNSPNLNDDNSGGDSIVIHPELET